MELNKYQTQLTDEFIKTVHPEVLNEFYEYVTGVPFIANLIAPDRRYAKDMPKDSEGKIIIDFSKPHILEDMDYFRQTAIHFQKYGKFTKMRVNSQKHSPYMRWFKEEVRRCWEGMVRESDGEWISGRMYFYLNYFPIIQTIIKDKEDKVGDRVVDFPEIWEGVYWRFHYLDKARKIGKHAVEIASRGKSKSYSVASILLHILLLGESKKNNKQAKALLSAYNKEYLIKDGTITKMLESLNFLKKQEEIQFPKRLLKESMSDMQWIAGWEDENKVKKGTSNEVISVAIADDPDKMRGKRSIFMGYEEFGMYPKFLDVWQISFPNVQDGQIVFGLAYAIGTGGSEGCLTANNKVFTKNGDLKYIKDLNYNDGIIGFNQENKKFSIEEIEYINNPTYKECIKITTNSFRTLECSIDHPILASNKYDYNERRIFEWIESNNLKIGDKISIINEIPLFDNKPIFDSRLIGMLIGDGSYITSPKLHTCDEELRNYVINKYDTSIYKEYKTKDNKIFTEIGIKKIRNELRNLGIYGQSKNNKTLPKDIFRASKKDISNLIGGLFDTDGNINIYNSNKGNRLPTCTISLSSSSVNLLNEIQLLLIKLGIYSNIIYKKPQERNRKIKDINGYYSLEISTKDGIINFYNNINLLLKYKQNKLKKCYDISLKKKSHKIDRGYTFETITNIEYIGRQKVYNLSANNTHTYIGNGIITHNSDFTGALEMIFYPTGYNVLGLPNIYDKGSTGQKETIFFYPSFVNMKPFYNKDGVSDVVGAMLSELEYRRVLKYNSSDPLQLTRRKAEYAFTLQDAIMRRDGTLYPVHDINERVMQIDNNPSIENKLWNGRLLLDNGKVKFIPDADARPIRNFPHKDNKNDGCVTIHKMPVFNSEGEIPWGRYIAGADTYDDDHAETLSFFSGIILDLWTNEIVLEYTGRPMFAKEAYENWRLCLIMYNAECNYENNKKGLFQHFSQFHSLRYLSDTLDFLKEKDPQKVNYYGNKSKGTGNYGGGKGSIAGYARGRIRDWLLEPKDIIIEDEENPSNISIESVPNLYTLDNRALLQELALWNNDLNTDRHDALAMLMLLREDKLRLFGDSPKDTQQSNDSNYLGNDSFFTKNFNKKRNKNNSVSMSY